MHLRPDLADDHLLLGAEPLGRSELETARKQLNAHPPVAAGAAP